MTRRTDLAARMQQAGLLTAIPFVLLVGPSLGYYVGSVADRHWDAAPWGMGIGILLGLVSSARLTVQLIRQATNLTRQDRQDD